MAYYAFFLKKIKKYQVTSVKEEGRQAKHSTNYSGWRQTATSCKGTNQNNRPLLKGHEGLPPHPSPYKPPPAPPATLRLMSEGFPPGSAGICSRYLIPHVPTGVTWLEFSSHFISLQPVVKPDPNQLWLQQLVKFISVVCSCNQKPDNALWECLVFSLPNYSEPQFNFMTSLLTFQHLPNNLKEVYQRWFQEIFCASNHTTFQSECDFLS